MPEELLPNQDSAMQNINESQTNQNLQSVVNQKSPHKFPILKFFMLGVLFIFGLSLIAAAYFMGQKSNDKSINISPTPVASNSQTYSDDTDDWKTYEGDGFSFKYPSVYKLKEEKSSDNFYPNTSLIFNSDNSRSLRILIYNNKNQNEYLENICESDNCTNATNIKVNSVNARKIINPPFPISSELVVFEKNNKLFAASVEQPEENSSNEINKLSKQNFFKILATFKFTDSNSQSTTNTSDWKTYENNKYNFSIKYPNTINEIKGNWKLSETVDTASKIESIGFGPSGLGDYTWGIRIFSENSIDEIINSIGAQFSDRKVTRENIKVNNNDAILVKVTTKEVPDWISKTILIEKNGTIYAIENGAREINEFETFYKSFKFN